MHISDMFVAARKELEKQNKTWDEISFDTAGLHIRAGAFLHTLAEDEILASLAEAITRI